MRRSSARNYAQAAFYTAVRVSELVRIKVSDIDFAQCKIIIEEGKGRRDWYILFPASFRLVLQSHLRANPKNRYLFETTRCTPFTTRRVQQIVKLYAYEQERHDPWSWRTDHDPGVRNRTEQ